MAGGTLHLSGLWPPFAAAVQYYLQAADYYGIPITIVSGYRSPEEQARLYAQGRTAAEIQARVKKQGRNGAVTDAPPGTSPHNYGLAVDIESPRLSDAKKLATLIGFGTVSWDPPHLEWPGWQSLLR